MHGVPYKKMQTFHQQKPISKCRHQILHHQFKHTSLYKIQDKIEKRKSQKIKKRKKENQIKIEKKKKKTKVS